MRINQVFDLASANAFRNYREAVNNKGANSPEAVTAQAQFNEVRQLQKIFALIPSLQTIRCNERVEQCWGVYTSVLEISAEVYGDIMSAEPSYNLWSAEARREKGVMVALGYISRYLASEWGVYCPCGYYAKLY